MEKILNTNVYKIEKNCSKNLRRIREQSEEPILKYMGRNVPSMINMLSKTTLHCKYI